LRTDQSTINRINNHWWKYSDMSYGTSLTPYIVTLIDCYNDLGTSILVWTQWV